MLVSTSPIIPGMTPFGSSARMSVIVLEYAAEDVLYAKCQVASVLDHLAANPVAQVMIGNVASGHAVLTEPAIFKRKDIALNGIEESHALAGQLGVMIDIMPMLMKPG